MSRAAASRSPGVGQDSPGCVPPGAAGDSAPGMCARPTHVEPADPGNPVASVSEEGPPGEDLVEGVLAVHRVPAAEPVLPLEARRRDDVTSDDPVSDTRRMDLERSHGPVRYTIARCLVPVPAFEMPRRVLKQRRDDVGPSRGERGV